VSRALDAWQWLWLAVVAVAMAAALSGFADADNYTAQIVAMTKPAQTPAQRFADAAQKICGYGAAWSVEGAVVQCYRHTGGKTITAEVAQ
jgi:hypothetical protein